MRTALPNAFFFGLTGTPINKLDKNTFATFGAVEDRTGYMSRYSFADSVSDGATLPLHFEPVPVKLRVDQAAIDEAFKALADEVNLTEEERSGVARRVRMSAIMKDPERIKAVCEHIAEHFMNIVNPNGFKAQVVCYDRECCVLYKKELDRLLGEATSTIVMDTNNDKADEYRQWRRTREEEAKVLDDFRDPNNPLQIVIVTSKLLTGFDAPILQAMYLDKPMKDHEDYERFLDTLRRYRDELHFEILAYCLMENHIHLLLHADSDLAQIMKKVAGSYAYYFNEKYGRSGHLFQDRYSSEPINDEKYLLAVVRYIHNNPQKAGICPRDEYPWSSWHEYISGSDLISSKTVLEICGNLSDFLEFSASNEEVECLDISDRKRLTDKEAQEIIKTALHIESGTQIQGMSRGERDAALNLLKENGLSIRQIERLTGINRGVILKA